MNRSAPTMAQEPSTDHPWNAERSASWVAMADQREAQLAPVLEWLLEAAGLASGEQVLDVGCGTGPSTARAAAAVGATGSVTGLDLWPVMLAAARDRVEDPRIEWLCADAAGYAFEPGRFDVVISRFGTMFFSDPAAAFANLARATRPGGRLAMAVWPLRTDSPFFEVPYRTVAAVLDQLDLPYQRADPDADGSSLGAPGLVEALLERSGWREVSVRRHDEPLYVGGPADIDQAVTTALEVGPTYGLLANRPGPVREAARVAMRQLVSAQHDGTGWPLVGGVLVVTARRG